MSEGRRQLLAILQRTLAIYVAARCRVTKSAVSKWASGRTQPAPEKKIALFVNYKIPTAAWGDSPRRRVLSTKV